MGERSSMKQRSFSLGTQPSALEAASPPYRRLRPQRKTYRNFTKELE